MSQVKISGPDWGAWIDHGKEFAKGLTSNAQAMPENFFGLFHGVVITGPG